MRFFSVLVRGAAAPAGVIAPDHHSQPEPAPVPEPRACTETTAAGEPCKGRPGDDGLCAAHKRKETPDAGPGADGGADQAAEEAHAEEAVSGEQEGKRDSAQHGKQDS